MIKEDKIIIRIKDLRGELKQALQENKDNREVDIATAKYNYYLNGLEAGMGFAKVCKLVKIAKEKE